jgi:hypothetical protein
MKTIFKTAYVLALIALGLFLANCNRERGTAKILDVYYDVLSCKLPYIAEFDCDFDTTYYGKMEFNWEFGDGNSSNERAPTHIYQATGVYKVKLTIKNYDRTDTKSFALDLSSETLPVLPRFTYSAIEENYRAPAEIKFYNQSQHSQSFFWNFGDSKGSDLANPTHIFYNSGTFNVKLRADCNGDTAYSTQQVVIDPAPKRIRIEDIRVWLPNNFLNNAYYVEVDYGIFSEFDTWNEFIVANTFPMAWRPLKELFFFSGTYTNDKILFKIWNKDNNSTPVYSFFITSSELQNSYYPRFISWNDGSYKAEVYFGYN